MAAPRTLYARVGALILIGAALAVGFVLFLTSARLGEGATVLETYLSESVTGLDVGAAVRFRGVAVGRVTALRLAAAEYERPAESSFNAAFRRVVVRFAIDPTAVGQSAPSLEEAVRLGLRVRLASQGITGVNYIEMDFVDPARFPPNPFPWTPKNPVVPAMPSTVAQVQSAAEQILTRIEQAPIDNILRDAGAITSSVRAQLTDGDLAQTLHEVLATMKTLRDTIVAADLPGAVADLRGVATDTRALIGGAEVRATLANTAAAAADLRQAIARLPAAIAGVEQAVRTIRSTASDTQADIGPVLRELRATVSNLRDTTEQIRRAPSQAIWGAPPPPPTNRDRR
ncbi:paraquat-inducible protein B [Humitalea rosea]|uniref:Paraquat-inducible protein B n=1 Tax=Humitalea rosea TaxID=990373 RepID=A0A2W7IMG6_9PROT|nr:MlaD family protein [Humitalea rosea]PZW48360.1 paraquat-inducible protein B [Humitalea rosea]